MWTKYQVEMRFLNSLCASVPADRNLVDTWVRNRTPGAIPANARSLDEIATEVMETLLNPEEVQPSLHVFQRVDGKPVMRAGTVRAHIKECGRWISSITGKVEGERSFAVRVVNAVYIDPKQYWLPILDADTGKPAEVAGQREKPIHMNTPKGPRSAIKVYEYIENGLIRVPIMVMETKAGKPVISQKDLESIFKYGAVHGYGGERGDGEGRYMFTLTEVKQQKKAA